MKARKPRLRRGRGTGHFTHQEGVTMKWRPKQQKKRTRRARLLKEKEQLFKSTIFTSN